MFPSTLNPAFSLNIENAASTPYTLTLMSWIALIFAPLILAYQAWSYWVFRKRISVQADSGVAHRAQAPHGRRRSGWHRRDQLSTQQEMTLVE